MIRKILGIGLWLGILGVMGGMEQGSIEISKGFAICLIMVFLMFYVCLKKKSAAPRKCNGQAHYVHIKNHTYYTPKKDGLSSGI